MFIQTILAEDPLSVDDTHKNIICPECGGGLHKEKSFSITQKADGVLYNCYRATCSLGGGFIPLVAMLAPKRKKKEFKPRLYTEPLIGLNADQHLWFMQRYGLTSEELSYAGVKYNSKRDTYTFPVRDYAGRDVGLVDRAYWGRKPKSITYWFNDCVKMHFQWEINNSTIGSTAEKQDTILVVEDQLSGIKASRFMDTAVLLGTNFNYEIATHLRQFTHNIIMALDADATNKAIKYKQLYGVMFGNFNVYLLSKGGDIKDLSDDEIEEILNNDD